MSKIEVYLWSTKLSGKLTSLHYSYDYHYFMEKHFRKNYHWLRDQGFSKGRIFKPDSAALLPVLARALEVEENRIRIYDLNSSRGKIHAWLAGIWQAPAVIIDRQKFIGVSEARRALFDLIEDHSGIEYT